MAFPGSCCQFPGCTLDYNHLGDHAIHGMYGIPARIEPHFQRCKATDCTMNHSYHYCRACHNPDSFHITAKCPTNPSGFITPPPVQQIIVRCRAYGCDQNHRFHHCGNCGDNDSTHCSRNCPSLPSGMIIQRSQHFPSRPQFFIYQPQFPFNGPSFPF
jgi:hypothetical protein